MPIRRNGRLPGSTGPGCSVAGPATMVPGAGKHTTRAWLRCSTGRRHRAIRTWPPGEAPRHPHLAAWGGTAPSAPGRSAGGRWSAAGAARARWPDLTGFGATTQAGREMLPGSNDGETNSW
ncbi:hypothetical protein FHR38_005784 [Micromonospora polyrhachis]|uniref:Uncharacterized protein n=1 Tax=Micromonospora polyrhachis TaxID=1282883 RepID=A0A7W7SWV9_9ACTN|nr:hypothetical protein [Micromonospora polyrhachis]